MVEEDGELHTKQEHDSRAEAKPLRAVRSLTDRLFGDLDVGALGQPREPRTLR